MRWPATAVSDRSFANDRPWPSDPRPVHGRLDDVRGLQARADLGEHSETMQGERLLEPFVQTGHGRDIEQAQLVATPLERPLLTSTSRSAESSRRMMSTGPSVRPFLRFLTERRTLLILAPLSRRVMVVWSTSSHHRVWSRFNFHLSSLTLGVFAGPRLGTCPMVAGPQRRIHT